ncbi:hypothetical protein [Acidomonas methanolica]|uniref:hypothetical protein n=1 Tax=Acidomonas methanolica TaxID=437 RepID=UPI00211A9FBA|nr:hypothetical protein [Acidomonas methanolica]MCQ9154146.1 hypothetical protein [Acidomonas methanolica]
MTGRGMVITSFTDMVVNGSVPDDMFRNPSGVNDYVIGTRYWYFRRSNTVPCVSDSVLLRAGKRRDGLSSVIAPSFQWIFIVLFETKKRELS